jgi:hypothetical protein
VPPPDQGRDVVEVLGWPASSRTGPSRRHSPSSAGSSPAPSAKGGSRRSREHRRASQRRVQRRPLRGNRRSGRRRRERILDRPGKASASTVTATSAFGDSSMNRSLLVIQHDGTHRRSDCIQIALHFRAIRRATFAVSESRLQEPNGQVVSGPTSGISKHEKRLRLHTGGLIGPEEARGGCATSKAWPPSITVSGRGSASRHWPRPRALSRRTSRRLPVTSRL